MAMPQVAAAIPAAVLPNATQMGGQSPTDATSLQKPSTVQVFNLPVNFKT